MSARLAAQHLDQICNPQKIQNPRRHVGEFQHAVTLVDGRNFEADEGTEARTVQLVQITQIQDNAASISDQWFDGIFKPRSSVAD